MWDKVRSSYPLAKMHIVKIKGAWVVDNSDWARQRDGKQYIRVNFDPTKVAAPEEAHIRTSESQLHHFHQVNSNLFDANTPTQHSDAFYQRILKLAKVFVACALQRRVAREIDAIFETSIPEPKFFNWQHQVEDENINIQVKDRVIDFNEVWRIVCKSAEICKGLESFK